MTYAVQVASIPFATKRDGSRIYITERIDVEDIGVVIEGPDREGDVLVLFDDRVERINPACLDEADSPTRVQMWDDMLWLEAGNTDDAVETYWKHIRHLKHLMTSSGKTCSACSEFKPLSEYRNHAGERDGLYRQCRSCEKKYNDARRRSFQ